MKFALVIFETDESRRRIQADRAGYRKEYEGWIGGLAAAGKLAGGDALETEHTAPATVRSAADGTSIVTDGPAHTPARRPSAAGSSSTWPTARKPSNWP
jgi:hypothetical protein